MTLERLAEWLLSPTTAAFVVLIALLYLALFGIRVGPRENPRFEIHGIVTSIWVGAQTLAGIRTDIQALRHDVARDVDRLEKKVDRLRRRRRQKPDDSIRLSIPR